MCLTITKVHLYIHRLIASVTTAWFLLSSVLFMALRPIELGLCLFKEMSIKQQESKVGVSSLGKSEV